MDITKTAIRAARIAGGVLDDYGKKEIKYDMKNDYDILAEADLQCEKVILEEIKRVFPGHSVFSEEQGKEIKGSEYRWIVDPLDGTLNFAKGLEEYCVSIAVEKNDELILGVVYQPNLDRLYVAERGSGAFLNDERMRVSDENEIKNMFLATDNTSNIQNRVKMFEQLSRVCDKVRGIRIFGSGSLHFARIASGTLDIYCKTICPHYWDYAAGTILVKEAGGMVTDLEGNEIRESFQSVVASNGKKHQEVLELLNQAR